MSHIFISHASLDREAAQKICQLIEAEGVKCWIAPRDIRAGHEYALEIMEGIAQCSAMVLVLTTPANDSTFVKREVERAVSRKKPVIPIRLEDVMPAPSLELFVSGSHWIDAWGPGLEAKASELYAALAGLGLGKPGARASTSLPDRSPRPVPPEGSRRRWLQILSLVLVVLGSLAGLAWWAEARRVDISAVKPNNMAAPTAQPTPSVVSTSVALPIAKSSPAKPQPETTEDALHTPDDAGGNPPSRSAGVAGTAAQATGVATHAVATGSGSLHAKPSSSPVAKDKAMSAGVGTRCAELLNKIGVGEPLSSHEQNEFNTTCH